MSVSRSITAATAATSHNAAAMPINTRIRSVPEFLDLPIFSSLRRFLHRRCSHYPTTPAGIARRVIEAYNAGDPEVLRTLHGPTAIVHEADDDGLIVAERQYWNMLQLLAQLSIFAPMPIG